jgi:hypothetical protein
MPDVTLVSLLLNGITLVPVLSSPRPKDVTAAARQPMREF